MATSPEMGGQAGDRGPEQGGREMESLLGCLLAMRGIAARLREVNDLNEKGFVSAGQRLGEFSTRCAAVAARIAEAQGELTGERCRETLAAIPEMTRRLKDLFLDEGSEKSGWNERLAEIMDLLERSRQILAVLRQISKTLKILSVSTKIQSSNLTRRKAAFLVFAREITSLAREVADKVAELSLQLERLRGMMGGAIRRMRELEQAQGAKVTLFLQSTAQAVDTLDQQGKRSAEATTTVAEAGRSVDTSLKAIIMAIQYQDITRQEVERTRTELVEGARRLERGEGTEDVRPLLASCHHLGHLSLGTVRKVRQDLSRALEEIRGNLRNIVGQVGKMNADMGRAEEAGSRFAQQLQMAIGSIEDFLIFTLGMAEEVSSIMASIPETVSTMAAFMREIRELGAAVELIAFNARIKDANLRGGSGGLDVIAEAIRQVSETGTHRAEDLSGCLARITSLATQVKVAMEEDSLRKGDVLSVMIEGLGDHKAALQAVKEGVGQQIHRSWEDGRDLALGVERTLAGLQFPEMALGILDDVVEQITTLEGMLGRYTMTVPGPAARGEFIGSGAVCRGSGAE